MLANPHKAEQQQQQDEIQAKYLKATKQQQLVKVQVALIKAVTELQLDSIVLVFSKDKMLLLWADEQEAPDKAQKELQSDMKQHQALQ